MSYLFICAAAQSEAQVRIVHPDDVACW